MFGNRCNKVIDPLTVQIYKNTAKTSRKKTHQQTFGMSALSDTKSAVLQLSFPWTFSTAEFVFYTELWRHVWSPNSNLTLQSIYSDRGPEMCFRGSRFETKASHWLKLRMDFAKRSSYLIYIRKCPYMVFGSRRKSNWWTSGISYAVCFVSSWRECALYGNAQKKPWPDRDFPDFQLSFDTKHSGFRWVNVYILMDRTNTFSRSITQKQWRTRVGYDLFLIK